MNNQQSNYTFTPHDLRIGNVVNYHSSEDGLLPNTIDAQDLATFEANPIYFNQFYSPIPITVEMLVEELGFGKRIDGNCIDLYIGINPITHDWLFHIKYIIDDNIFFYQNGYHEIRYLHELQNLYHSLTREMLTLKSK
jgi:hypothetical protein